MNLKKKTVLTTNNSKHNILNASIILLYNLSIRRQHKNKKQRVFYCNIE